VALGRPAAWHGGGLVARGSAEMERVGWRDGPVRGKSRHREGKWKSGEGDRGIGNAAISVEERDGGEQTPDSHDGRFRRAGMDGARTRD
jgi:hypothetical protein